MKKIRLCTILLLALLMLPASFPPLQMRAVSAGPAAQLASPDILRGFMTNGKLTDNDFESMKSWGANGVRLQVLVLREAEKLKKPLWDAWPTILDMLEQEVVRARNAGLKVVIDMHGPPLPNVQANQPEMWSSPDLVTGLKKVWKDIAQRMAPYRDSIWGYDLLNEPLDRTQLPNMPSQWPAIATEIITEIRTVDPDTYIIFETGPGFYFTGFRNLTQPLPDPKVIYSAHFYAPSYFTHQGILTTDVNQHYPELRLGELWDKQRLELEMQAADDFQAKWNVPIYVGELSVIRWAPKEDALQWLRNVLDLIEERGWSWTYHAFREFNAWSLEHDETYYNYKDASIPSPLPVNYETERAKVVKEYLRKNNTINTTLQGPKSVEAGRKFALQYGLQQVTGHVYGQDVEVAYDEHALKFDSVDSLQNDFKITNVQKNIPGKVRFSITGKSNRDSVSSDGVVAKIEFKTLEPGTTDIKVNSAVLSGGAGEMWHAGSSSFHLYIEDDGNNAMEWNFNRIGEWEGWTVQQDAVGAVNIGTLDWATKTSGFIQSPELDDLQAGKLSYLKMNIKNSRPASHAKLYFITNSDSVWNEQKSVGITLIPYSQGFVQHTVNMGENPHWKGKIRQIRLVPEPSNGTLYVDYIHLTRDRDADREAPSALSDLSAKAVTHNSVQLSWTAPGGDGNTGKAAFYDIRFAAQPITDATWDNATHLTGEPLPAAAGTEQNYTINGLSEHTTYYYAIKAVNDQAKVSPLSNVLTVTTNSRPEIIKQWEFDTAGSTEGWTLNSQLGGTVSGGSLALTSSGNDPYLLSPDNLAIADSLTYRNIRIRLKNDSPYTKSQLFFTTSGDPSWTSQKSVTFTLTAQDGQYNEYVINMGQNTNWNGVIRRLRFDPIIGQGTVHVDWIRVTQ